jgi:hypothetical protein
MNARAAVPLVALLVFGAYTLSVMAHSGVLGFLTLAGREPWALQMLLDLLLSLGLFVIWMLRDARERGLPGWLYAVLTLTCGSPGALAYLVHRGLAERRR